MCILHASTHQSFHPFQVAYTVEYGGQKYYHVMSFNSYWPLLFPCAMRVVVGPLMRC